VRSVKGPSNGAKLPHHWKRNSSSPDSYEPIVGSLRNSPRFRSLPFLFSRQTRSRITILNPESRLNIANKNHYCFKTFSPPLLFTITSWCWALVESNAKLLAPWRAMAKRLTIAIKAYCLTMILNFDTLLCTILFKMPTRMLFLPPPLRCAYIYLLMTNPCPSNHYFFTSFPVMLTTNDGSSLSLLSFLLFNSHL